jgi:methyl-accepting chemotaxis protein
MLNWFRETAPLKSKLTVAFGIQTASSAFVLALLCLREAQLIPAAVAVTIAAATLLICALVAAVTRRMIVVPLQTTIGRLEALAAGDVATTVPLSKNRDCAGRLAKVALALVEASQVHASAGMRDKAQAEANGQASAQSHRQAVDEERALVVRSIGAGLSSLAAKDLTFRMPADVPESYSGLQCQFNIAIAQFEAAMAGVADRVGAIQSGASEISLASSDLSRRTEQQAASLEETAAALDQITATVKKSATGAVYARQVVAAADEDAKMSAVVVRGAVEAMDAIAQSARQISQIIGVIDEIAFQTNLLALNAGVEAARAGDAGRGFAVVAAEVRALAQRSAAAAKEIKGLISASTAQVDQGVKLVAETGRSLERIMAQVSEINAAVADIAAGAKEQSTGLEAINAAINQMDRATQQNAAMVEQSTAAGRALTQESVELSGLIGQFTLGRAESAAPSRHALRKFAPKSQAARAGRLPGATPAAAETAPPRRRERAAAPNRPIKATVNGAPALADADGWEEF